MVDRAPSADVTDGGRGSGASAVVLDFGSQYSQLIVRRVRECGVYCELYPHDAPWERIAALRPGGLILSGGPASVYEPGAPQLPRYVLESGLPILGICYGMQLLAQATNGRVESGEAREYGPAVVRIVAAESPLFVGLPAEFRVWMSHGDHVVVLPPGYRVLAESNGGVIAAMARDGQVGLQFHPEVAHTEGGKQILSNFLFKICGLHPTWTPGSFVQKVVPQIQRTVGGARTLCGLSGGVDSTVAATLVHRAIGDQLTCVFVNNGLLRQSEAEEVQSALGALGLPLVYVDASDRFLARLRGVVDPEAKRRIIGEEFIRVFEDAACRMGSFEFLVQGTLYPDLIESAAPERKDAATIKTHHNVGGLPSDLQFRLLEPLRYLFKDEVRAVGREMGLPEELLWRHPFPGPGLAVRIIGEVTPERLAVARAADAIFTAELRAAGLYRAVAQALVVLTPLRSVGVMGDGRTYANVVALRAVTTEDFMTADWARLPHDLLAKVANRVVNEVRAVNRVVFDITSKPPATIEWE